MKFYLFVREFGVSCFGSLTHFLSGVWRKSTHYPRNDQKKNGIISVTSKAIHLTMITTYGIQPGGYSDDTQSQVTMNDLCVE